MYGICYYVRIIISDWVELSDEAVSVNLVFSKRGVCWGREVEGVVVTISIHREHARVNH